MAFSVSVLATALLAFLHFYILVLEMFLWTTPRGRKAFKLTPEFAQQTRSLAANMGLYNGFLGAGLVWGLLHPDAVFREQICTFFLGCVVVAGLFGGVTANKKIFYVQFAPGALALTAVLLGI